MKNETDALNEAIIVLTEKREKQLVLMKEQFHTSYESLKPSNLIKSVFREVPSSNEIKNKILGPAIGLGSGYILKKLWVGSSHNPVKRILGTIIHFAVASVVSIYSDGIKNAGANLLHRYSKNNQKKNFIT